MIARIFSRSALHEHADPAQRAQGVAALPADSGEIAHLMTSDPAPEVRVAAAQRCTAHEALAGALAAETEPAVRAALTASLGTALAATPDDAAASACLAAESCPDAVRIEVARAAASGERRRAALAHVRDESLLVDLALTADIAETRQEAAERVHSADALRKLSHGAKNKDRGVARLARQRIDAMTERAGQAESADAMLTELEALAGKPGPIVSAMVDLDRRWQVLVVAGDDTRLARWATARAAVQARFDREQDEQRARAQYERRLREWLDALPSRRDDAIDAVRAEAAALREVGQGFHHAAAVSMLEDAERRIGTWEHERAAQAGAEALVVEAEKLAAGTSIDHADLPARWAALDRSMRGPALTQRFEAALIVIEQRRLAQIHATEQQASAARAHVHALLHTAEQALAAGQLQAARAAADEIRSAKAAAGQLPKPTVQRLSRLVQQLTELERWESFGQRQARLQLCERAEALAAPGTEAAKLAVEVQKLRSEWKALDAQHAGVPKAVWERFDGACERAYAPAARHFAEMAAQRKEARRKREEFIATATAHAPTLLAAEPRDLRAIERWLREADKTWREGDLGSVEPGAWKKLDARMKAALLPLRDALAAERDRAKAGREALIAEAVALAARATERDSLNQVKAIQARWQAEAKAAPLAHRDERVLWEAFRAACDAVFDARHAKRKEEDERKHGNRRALEEICVQLETLAHATDRDDAEVRRALREAQDQWRQQAGRPDPSTSGVEARFRSAKNAIEAMLSARARSRESAVWQTLAAKEHLCEDLDRAVLAGADDAANEAGVGARWSELPSLPAASEAKMVARRDAALRALADPVAAADHAARIDKGKTSRHEWLLELEMALKLDTPADLQAYRLALQVKQLKERFSSASSGGARTPPDLLLAWCAQPGVADARDRQRCERIVAAMAKGG